MSGLGLCHVLQQEQSLECAVCGEPLSSDARFTSAWGFTAESLINLGICPLCRSMPPVGGRNVPELRAAWLASEQPATRPGVGLPFDLI